MKKQEYNKIKNAGSIKSFWCVITRYKENEGKNIDNRNMRCVPTVEHWGSIEHWLIWIYMMSYNAAERRLPCHFTPKIFLCCLLSSIKYILISLIYSCQFIYFCSVLPSFIMIMLRGWDLFPQFMNDCMVLPHDLNKACMMMAWT